MFKNFIDINDFNKNELEKILLFAKKIKKNPSKYDKILKNKGFYGTFHARLIEK